MSEKVLYITHAGPKYDDFRELRPPHTRRRSRWLPLALGATLIGLGVVVGWML